MSQVKVLCMPGTPSSSAARGGWSIARGARDTRPKALKDSIGKKTTKRVEGEEMLNEFNSLSYSHTLLKSKGLKIKIMK